MKDIPLCACGCGKQVTWDKRHQRWYKYFPDHRFNNTTEKGDPPLCACGCGEKVTWTKWHKRKWNKYLPHHSNNLHHKKPMEEVGNKIMPSEDAPLCACGCGKQVTWNKRSLRNNYWKWNKYLPNHSLNVSLYVFNPSEEWRKIQSERMKSQWENPEYRKIQTEKIKSRWMDPEWAVDMRKRYSESLKAQWENPEYREKHTEISRIIFSSPENQEKQKKAMEIKWAEPTFKAMQREKGSAQFRSPECRKQISEQMKERWEDPEFINKFLKSQNTSPNKPEQIINSLTPEIVEFVGNRKWWRTLKIKDENGNEIIRHKNPDFIVKGHHKVIEIFGDYWHRGDTPEKWHEAWEKIGYKLLIIWEHDIHENIENTLNNINNFIGETNEQTI